MKFFKNFTKINILIGVIALSALVLPTLVTFWLTKRNDAADEKLRNIAAQSEQKMIVAGTDLPNDISINNPEENSSQDIQSAADTAKESDENTVKVDNTKENKKSTNIETVQLEKATTDSTALTTPATAGDATPAEPVKLNGKKVYLTFDDGPSDNTDAILDILAEYNVKATFFVVVADDSRADQLNRIVAEGHTIGLHSKCHVYSTIYKDLFSFEKDVSQVHNNVKRITGVDTKYYRFPGGSSNVVSDVSKKACVEYLHDNGYEYYDWNAESQDAENMYLSPDQLNSNVMRSVRNNEGNSIVLMHDLDDHNNTVSALPALIETLQAEGYELCPIDENAPTFQHYMPE